MNFNSFLCHFYSSFNAQPSEQRIGQFFMNELYRHNQELYRQVPADLDCFYNDVLLQSTIDWVADRW